MSLEGARKDLQADLLNRAAKKRTAAKKKKKEKPAPVIDTDTDVLTHLREIKALLEKNGQAKPGTADFVITKRDSKGNVKRFKVTQT